MILVLDASAMMALLLNRPSAEIIKAALAEEDAQVYAHRINVLEVFYNLHRRGAMAKYLENHPEARTLGDPTKPDMTGIDVFDPTIFDMRAGEVEARAALLVLDALGVQISDALDANICEQVARLKSQFRRVSLSDCFGVALTQRLGGEFLTSDRHELEALEAEGVAHITFIH